MNTKTDQTPIDFNKPAHTIDRAASERGRDDGIERAEQGAPFGWSDEALALVQTLAKQHPYICSDDLWAAGLSDPPEPRALGAVMRAAVKKGYIETTSHFVNTFQESRHRAPVRVWHSLIVTPWTAMSFVESKLLSRQKKVKS